MFGRLMATKRSLKCGPVKFYNSALQNLARLFKLKFTNPNPPRGAAHQRAIFNPINQPTQ